MSGIKFMGKNPDGESQGIELYGHSLKTLQATDKTLSLNLAPALAHPKGILRPEYKPVDSAIRPMDVGYDGRVYGSVQNSIVRSDDGFETIENGYDFSPLISSGESWQIRKATNTYSGYVVVACITTDGETTTRVYFSNEFDTGFAEVYEIPKIVTYMSTSFYNGGPLEQIGLIGEYAPLGVAQGLHLSRDGGQSWEKIKDTIVNDPAMNAHWHSAAYDPYTGRIFASSGDGDNRAFWVTDDYGETWEEMTIPENKLGITHLMQPTVIIPVRDKIVLTPDTTLTPCVFSLVRDLGIHTVGEEKWRFNFDLGFYDKALVSSFFGISPYAVSHQRDEIYLVYQQQSPRQHMFVLGSGDSGASWHVVYANNMAGKTGVFWGEGLVGLDKNGYMYSYIFDGTQRWLWKAKKLDWEFN